MSVKSKFLLSVIFGISSLILFAHPESNTDVKSAMEKFKSDSFKITKIELDKPIDLPKGLWKQIGTSEVIIGIDSLSFIGGNAVFGAFTYIYIPGLFKNPKEGLAFGARNITTHAGGFAAGSSAKIALISDHRIKINDHIYLVLESKEEGNFIEFDCNGFKSIGLKGVFEFDSTIFVSRGNTPVVRASFQAAGSDLNDLIFSTSITPFSIKGKEDFEFYVKNAVVDLSDVRNHPNFKFPSQYQSAYSEAPNLWRGFYLENIEVKLPPKFIVGENERIALSAVNFLIDKQGLSGDFFAKIERNKENEKTKKLVSLEEIGVSIVANNFVGGHIKGRSQIPCLKENLKFTGTIREEAWGVDWKVVLGYDGVLTIPMFVMDMKINPSSTLELLSNKDGFEANLMLYGTADFKQKLLNINGVNFEGLHISSKSPYLIKGYFGLNLSEPGKIGGFPVSLTEFGFGFGEGRYKLKIGANLKLSDKISAGASASIFGKEENGGFVLDRVQINRIMVDAKFSDNFSIKGEVEFYEDDVEYGNGFKGTLAVTAPVGSFEGRAFFGKKDAYRYWFVQVKANVSIQMGPITSKYIYGGVYYNMTPQQIDLVQAIKNPNALTDLKYTPTNGIALGVKLGMAVVLAGNPFLAEGEAVFEINFNSGGGVRSINLDGVLVLLSGRESPWEFYGTMRLRYESATKTFHGVISPKLNLLGVLKGVNEGGKVGDVVIHFGPDDWYVWVGRPLEPIGISILDIATFKSYIQFGSKIDNMAPPPSALLELLGNNPDLVIRDDGFTGKGGGVVFGARFGIHFDESFLIFYGKLDLGVGFDFMVRNYGKSARCEGRPGQIGMGGWYGSGQLFVYVRGEIGLQAMGSRFTILKLGLGALLQARLPNPFWARGTVGGEYSILGGMISGQCDFDIELGEKCNIVGAKSVTDIPIISDIKPSSGASKVDVFGIPQASFNLPVNKEFAMTDMDGNNRKFRIKVAEFTTTHNGVPVSGSTKLNSKQDVISFISTDVLPPNAPLKTYVKIQWEELKNGAWEIMTKENGSPEIQDSFTTFTTGDAPDHIPESNVMYSYPIRNQYNFLKSESPIGYIQLQRGQPYLFENPNNEWKLNARFKSPNKETREISYSYNISTREVLFSVPSELANETVYSLEFKKVPSMVRNEDRNSNTTTQMSGVVKIPKNTLSETVSKDVERDIYATAFKTSKYNSFSDKIDGSGSLQSMFDITTGNLTIVGGKYNASETIDEFELKGSGEYIAPMITATAQPDNVWYSNHLYPLIYQHYPNNGNCSITHRDTAIYGLQPMKAISIYTPQTINGYKLTEVQVKASSAPTKQGQLMFAYKLANEAYKDFFDLRNQAINKFLNFGTSSLPLGAQKLIMGQFPDMMTGNQYKLRLRYMLPGKNIITSFKDIMINY